jgi:hypothetical protein
MVKKLFMITEENCKVIEKMAVDKGICKSEVVRRIIDSYFSNQQVTPKPTPVVPV